LQSKEQELVKMLERARCFCEQAAGFAMQARNLRLKACELEDPTNPDADRDTATGLRRNSQEATTASHQQLNQFFQLKGEIEMRLLAFGQAGRQFREALRELFLRSLNSQHDFYSVDEDGILRGCQQFQTLCQVTLETLARPKREKKPSHAGGGKQRGPASVTIERHPSQDKWRSDRRAKTKTNLSIWERRAAIVAKVIEELNQLRPQMTGEESAYAALRSEYPHFLTFKTARKQPGLKEKVLNIQLSRRHIRLAQEIAAVYSGVALSTVKDDWKYHKPAKYRQANRK